MGHSEASLSTKQLATKIKTAKTIHKNNPKTKKPALVKKKKQNTDKKTSRKTYPKPTGPSNVHLQKVLICAVG